MISNRSITESAVRLYNNILKEHWNGRALEGPDPGIRFNARIGRFIKSYFNFMPWADNLLYAQAQKYWIMNNWLMSDLNVANKERCRKIALVCTDYLMSLQQPEGYWEYPNPEWKNRIATIEGNYAAMGLLETYNRTFEGKYLSAAIEWYNFAVNRIGFQEKNSMLAINYFCDRGNTMVPNNSASALRVFAMLAKATNDQQYLETCSGMVDWMNEVQLDSGELPYAVAGTKSANKKDRIHFLCYQYNAFQFLDLLEYFNFSQDSKILPVLEKLAPFVSKGVMETGATRYDCHHDKPEVVYYNTAVGAALNEATNLGMGNYRNLSDLTYERVISLLKTGGGVRFHSEGSYRLLTDRRSYPRYLAMILYHLLMKCQKV